MTDVTFIRSIPVLLADKSVPRLFFSGHLYPPQKKKEKKEKKKKKEKVIRHKTSDFDVLEIDLDMQPSFLNAEPFHCKSSAIWNTEL